MGQSKALEIAKILQDNMTTPLSPEQWT